MVLLRRYFPYYNLSSINGHFYEVPNVKVEL